MPGEARTIPVRMHIYQTAIPTKGFEHAAASRDLAEAVVVRVDFRGGAVGWGETLPRPYVTGETLASVVEDLSEVFWPALAGREVRAEDIGRIAAGAATGERLLNAAACAVEMAIALGGGGDCTRFSVCGKTGTVPSSGEEGDSPHFRTRRENGYSPLRFVRVSGVLGSSDTARTARQLRRMRWYGLRDFKLKLGLSEAVDAENLRIVWKRLHRGIRAGKCTLRVDVNSGWPAESVPDRVAGLAQYGVCVVEQPADLTAAEMAALARKCKLPVMADESLLTARDAEGILEEPRVWWNIRISKNGGLLPALDLCRRAAQRGIPFVIGCLVGESGILSAAQRRLLEAAPRPRFVEGNYGRFLLKDDLTRPSPRFGYGGRMKPLPAPGLGVEVDEKKLHRYGKLVKTLGA